MLVSAVFYAAIAVAAGRADGFAYTQLIRAGASFAAQGVLLPGQHAEAGYGYDGQFYFYLAEDPFLRSPATVASLDSGFRYRRLLYPLVAWLASGGERALVPRALVGVNLAAALLTVGLVARAAVAARASPWIGLLVAVFPGVWVPVVLDTTETLQTALAAAALVTGSALIAFVGCMAKETAAPVLLAGAVSRWRGGKPRGALVFIGALLLYSAWVASVRFLILPELPGWAQRLDLLVDFPSRHGDLYWMATHGSLASKLLPSAVAFIFLVALVRVLFTRDEATLAVAPYAAISLSLGVDTWIDALAYMRYAGFVLVLVILSWVRRRDRPGGTALLVATVIAAISVVTLGALLL